MKALAIFCVVLSVYVATGFMQNAYDEQTRTARAWIHGTMNIDAPDSFLEHAAFEGKKYALHPPLSAAVMVPFVLLLGDRVNQVGVAILIGAVDIVLVWMLVKDLWLTAFFAFGTTFWYEAIKGDTWAMPSVVAMAFTLLALNEIFGRRRGWLVGLWAGLAALGQYQLAFVIPVYFLMLSGWLPVSRSPQSSTSD